MNRVLKFAAVVVLAGIGTMPAGRNATLRGQVPATKASCAGVSMVLWPGFREPDGRLLKELRPPPDMPTFPVPALAPLIPAAELMPNGAPAWIFDESDDGTAYVKTAVRSYGTNRSVKATFRWLNRAMWHCGYRSVAGSSGRNGLGDPLVRSVDYQSQANPLLDLTVYAARAHRTTKVLYRALAASYPHRQKASRWLPKAQVARIRYVRDVGFGGESAPVRLTVTNPSLLSILRRAVDADHHENDSVDGTCLHGIGSAQINLARRARTIETIMVSPDCGVFSVRRRGGTRYGFGKPGPVWAALMTVAHLDVRS